MKKFLLTLTAAVLTTCIYAQLGCTADSQYTIYDIGIWPDSATGMPNAIVDQQYNEFITIVTPGDTLVDGADFGMAFLGTFTAIIDDIEITNVIGLPPNFDYACDPISCAFPGGEIRCAELYSTTNPTASDIGVYNIIIATEIHASNVPIINTYTINDTVDYYTITVSAVSAVVDKLYYHTFDLKDIFPNPVVNQANIQFVLGTAEDIIFKVYNLLGEEMESKLISSSKGVNTVSLNTSLYAEGVYLYSITNGRQVLTKRMVVKN